MFVGQSSLCWEEHPKNKKEAHNCKNDKWKPGQFPKSQDHASQALESKMQHTSMSKRTKEEEI